MINLLLSLFAAVGATDAALSLDEERQATEQLIRLCMLHNSAN